MDLNAESAETIRPNLMRRNAGGWLATSPNGATFSIGVTAPNEDEAVLKFRYAYTRWIEILKSAENT
jgi:hypothetical protein